MDSYLEDYSGYAILRVKPVRMEFHFSALRGDYNLCCGPVVVCGVVLVR
jgi:hypothetical protein